MTLSNFLKGRRGREVDGEGGPVKTYLNQNVRTLLPQVVLQTVRRGGGGEGGSSSNGGSEAMEFIAGVLQKEKRVKHLMADHFSIIYPFIVIHRYAPTLTKRFKI